MSDRDIVKKQQEQEAENKLFCENLRLIIESSDTILKKEEFFFCEFGSAFLSMAYIAKGGSIPLGVLISLWQKGESMDTCSHCGGEVYIIGAGGSPLSGQHKWWGYCGQCGTKKSGKKSTFGELWHPVVEMKEKFPNEAKIQGVKLKTLVEHLTGGSLS